jgi:predicted nucleic acid-binding protein
VLLVDTNVLLDVVTGDPQWLEWSQRQLKTLALQTRLIINPIVYSELSIGFRRIEEVESILETASVEVKEIPRSALFLAGKVFRTYRTRRGTKTGVLPDFFIGAHAAVQGLRLLTRDARRYRSYFPDITLITPGDA